MFNYLFRKTEEPKNTRAHRRSVERQRVIDYFTAHPKSCTGLTNRRSRLGFPANIYRHLPVSVRMRMHQKTSRSKPLARPDSKEHAAFLERGTSKIFALLESVA